MVRLEHTIHVIYKMHANQLFMLLARLLVNSRVLNFGGVNHTRIFDCAGRDLAPLIHVLFKGPVLGTENFY